MKKRLAYFTGLYMTIANLAAAEAPTPNVVIPDAELEAPRLIAPGDGWEVTDVALDFRWQHIPARAKREYVTQIMWTHPNRRPPVYRIQIARKRSFRKLVVDDTMSFVIWKQDITQRYIPEQILKSGTYYWRVQAVDGEAAGTWSETRSFRIVEAPAENPPLVRDISADNPVLMIVTGYDINAVKNGDTSNYFTTFKQEHLPADLRRYIAITGYGHVAGRSVEESFPVFEEARRLGITIFLRGTFSLSEIDHAFRNFPETIIGVEMDEMNGWWEQNPDNSTQRPAPYNYAPVHSLFLERAVKTAASNGRYYLQAEGETVALTQAALMNEPEWVGLMNAHAPYVIWGVKSNFSSVLYATQAAGMGMWLDNIVGNYCYWAEGFFWDHASYNDVNEFGNYRQWDSCAKFPSVMWPQQMLIAASQGATMFTVSGWNTAFDKSVDPATPYYLQYILPLFRHIVEKKLISTKQEVLAKIQVGVEAELLPVPQALLGMNDLDYMRSDLPEPSLYRKYDALFKHIYNLHTEHYDFDSVIPKSARYFFVPLLSPLVEKHAVPMVVPLDAVDTPEEVANLFDSRYEPWYEGDAWVARTIRRHPDQTRESTIFFIQNSHENRDITQSYKLGLGLDAVKYIHGEITLHSMIAGKLSGDGQHLWLYANTHHKDEEKGGFGRIQAPIRNSTIAISAAKMPEVTVKPATALVKKEWIETASQAGIPKHLIRYHNLVLTLDHTEGAVEVWLDR